MAQAALIPYIRQSKAKEKTISLDDQRRIIETWARNAGVALGPEVVEQGVSGSKPWRERELGGVIAACEEGRAGGVVVAFQDRLSRENGLATAEVWEALDKAGARLVAAGEGLDTATRSDDTEMLFSIKAAVARHQWKRYRANWSNAVDAAIARGVYVGQTPVGYDKDSDSKLLVKNVDEAAVREVFLGRVTGRSWNQLASGLEAAGVLTATGLEKWHINSVRSLVENPIYKGELTNGHTHYFPEYAIVTPSEWDAAQPTKDSPGARRDHGKWAVLGGLVFCEGCGHRMSPTRDARGFSYYRCQLRHCTAKARAVAGELDAFVIPAALDELARRVSERGIGQDASTEKLAGLEIAIEEAEGKRRGAAALGLNPDNAADAAVIAGLVQAVEDAKARLIEEARKTKREITVEEARAILENGTVEEKRTALGHIILEVRVARVGTRLRDEYRPADDAPVVFTAADLGEVDKSHYEASSALADRTEVTWR
jgi:DNA invertase Pin-like site-specific DNA recombinase